MTHTKLEKLIYNMLTESTGIHMCDSGGDNGRLWQRNQLKTIDDFKAMQPASIEITRYDEKTAYASPTINVFHYLTEKLSLDKLCDSFNKRPVHDWDGDVYGVSIAGQQWLNKNFTRDSLAWNTYNWDCPLSQTLQGIELISRETGDRYIVLQIHNGADVRGGYTDAKLFKLNSDMFLSCDLFSEYFDVYGNDLTSHEGEFFDSEALNALAIKLNIPVGDSIELPAHIM